MFYYLRKSVLQSRKEARLHYFCDKLGCKKDIDKPCSSNAVDFCSPTASILSELAGFSLQDREKLNCNLGKYEKPRNSRTKIEQTT